MSITTVDERRVLAQAVRSLLARKSSEADVRTAMSSELGYEPGLWKAMAAELGIQGMAVPEEFGGAGAGWLELGVVFEETGRALSCSPLLGTVAFGLSVLLEARDRNANDRWLGRIVSGDAMLTAALAGSAQDAGETALTASESGTGWVVDGTISYLLDGATAEACFVLANTGGGQSMFEIDLRGPHVCAEPVAMLDTTRRLAHVEFHDAPAILVGVKDTGRAVMLAARRRAAALLACEATGGAAAALDMAVEHAKTRVQFGQPIGVFQAVQHRCADMLVALESARSASWAFVCAIDSDDDDIELVAAATVKVCSQSYVACASGNVQVHGGVGFTFEHPAHLHVKRSRGSAVLFGSPHEHRAALNGLIPLFSVRQSRTDAVLERNGQ
ncbi:MAG: acyl-CoA dehydrogenase family protein [Aeromicrobium sp.]